MTADPRRLLIVDDEPIKRQVMAEELEASGYQVRVAVNPLEAEPLLQKEYFDVVVTDLRMPGEDGLSFLRRLRQERPEQAVIVMTAFGTVDSAVEAMRLGAYDYLQKPFSTEELMLKLDRLLRAEGLREENEALRRQLRCPRSETRLVGRSQAIRSVLAQVHAVSNTDTTVLVEGESGTGKELVARLVHETSHRREGPFVAVNCAALPGELVEAELFGHEAGAFTGAVRRRLGRFELAHGGTLFIDDVDDIPPQVQVKLLRVLEQRTFERVGSERSIRVNIRLVAAAKRNLSALVASGAFRDDLFYRLNVVPIYLPPLRDRREDIPALVEHFLEQAALRANKPHISISPQVLERLCRYGWPGNVRELRHLIERLVTMVASDRIEVSDLPTLEEPQPASAPVSVHLSSCERLDLQRTLQEVEDRILRWALLKAQGNLARAAELLGIPRSTLQYKVAKAYGSAGVGGEKTPSPKG